MPAKYPQKKIRKKHLLFSSKSIIIIDMIKIYLDNCCYNRPYDNQSYLRISLESQAKLFIQHLIRVNQLELVTSYVLEYENSRNPHISRHDTIEDFFQNASEYIGAERNNEVLVLAEQIQVSGIKTADACHIACAELAKCDYFLTTDDRVLKYKTDKVTIVNPVQFIQIIAEEGIE